jgi:hypothetical protein
MPVKAGVLLGWELHFKARGFSPMLLFWIGT